MGSLFRSEEMTLCQLFLQSEAAYACVSELGELGLVQFRDLNPDVNAFQRKFVNEVRRCDEMERKLRFLEKEIKKDGIPMLDTGDNPEAPVPREMIDLEATFEKLENEMKEVNGNTEALKRNYLELTELKHILRKTQTFFEEAEIHHVQAMHDPSLTEENFGLLGEESHRSGQALRLGFVAGVIVREKIPAFERMLWRVCRGNVFLRQAEIESPLEDPVTGDQVNKSVFIIFFQGEQLKSRVKKICEGFRATLYPCPETPAERREMAIGVMTRIEDLNTVLGQTQDHRHRVLVAAARNIKIWFIKVRKIKAIYYTLNMLNLDVTQKCLIAECWCPVQDLDRIQQALRGGTERSGSSVPSILNRMKTKEIPPTYNRNNKLTQGFQNIIDAYGISTYQEVNPAPWAIISFPFLFAVMFGDFGHGFIMFLIALFLVTREKQLQAQKINNEIFDMFFGGRYIILLMGIFSMYTGLIYNDIFSKSFKLFDSSWAPHDPLTSEPYTADTLRGSTSLQLDPNVSYPKGGPYPFGLDPVWSLASNKITALNSLKMKISVIFGVSQMFLGVALSIVNHRFFNRKINIYCDFIPQVIFLSAIFGYLIIEIIIKWIVFSFRNVGEAPNLLIGLIQMFLFQSDKKNLWYTGQTSLQTFLVVLAAICIPWMWLIKPFYLRHQHRHGQFKHQPLSVNSGDIIGQDYQGEGEIDVAVEEEFDFGELFTHQSIHTIEYCLGCISHTASYLRLWALSLAHAQLSEVLWTMVMRIALQMDGIVGAFVLAGVFAFWACATVIVLILMEGLSAFLHTLRLHWVEFNSKFYEGQGYKFHPFSFEDLSEYSIED
ncbi:V-type proton ATPase 116 kDa subunit a 1-like isoform X2 [Ostrea edulis]|uniref:V-type proton ATPase 116 kDa subunit a 1-like isoform X2 n=1 Tax=Ostrea edulis TaxID=37623 RepID=UPI002096325A|nr:V-type proton ATPase 116 kDa subunit a 1-like isoform X2 [Ostrea edulis]XP_055995337.1 V-type proton ATPase 116 kDa subunit a 1-like isoform X2 [Ostrea edulis]